MQSPRSVDDQERECRAFAEREGWTVVMVEADAAVRAGAVAGRGGYRRLLEAAARGEFDILLVEEASRFSRDFLDGFGELAKLKRYGVRLADTKHGLVDLESFEGQLRIAIDLASSQHETKRLGERSKRGLKGKVMAKYSSGGNPAYGYKREPVFSSLEVDVDGRPKRAGVCFVVHPVEAPVIQRVFQLYAEGNSKHSIARRLNESGIPTRRAGKIFAGKPTSGTWATSSIKRILENELYTGVRIWNRHSRTGDKLPVTGKKQLRPNHPDEWVKVDGYAPRIIDEELWERVQLRLREDARKYQKKHACNTGRRKYLLSGLIRCANCQAKFVIGTHRRNMPHYRCSFRASRGGNVVCTNKIDVPGPKLEERVKHVVDAVAKHPGRLAALVAEHNRRISSANEGQLSVLRALEARREAAAAERDRFVDAIRHGTGRSQVLVAAVEKQEAEIADLGDRVRDAEALLQPLLMPRTAAVRDYVTGSASVFEGDLARDRQFLEGILDGIYVYADGAIVLKFKDESLFEPVSSYRIKDIEAESSRIAADRQLHRDGMAMMSVLLAKSGKDLAGAEFVVREDDNGSPWFTVLKDARFLDEPARKNVSVPCGI